MRRLVNAGPLSTASLIAAGMSFCLSGCMGTAGPPPSADLLAGAEAAPAYPELTIALLPSAEFQGGGASGEFIAPSEVKDMFIADLRRQFKSVIRLDMPEQASRSGADLVVSLEGSFFVPPTGIFDECLASFKARFLTPEGELLGTVVGRGKAQGSKDTSFGFGGRIGKSIRIALKRALDDFDRNLAAFDQIKARRSTAVVAAIPSVSAKHAAPSYRSDVEAPSFRLPEDESKFAIVVGVESYQALPKADHAGRDARAVKAHLLGLGYPERNVVLLTDQQAGKSGLEKYLESWLQRNTNADSKVLFYFSGHGAPNPEDGQAYLMPWDGDPKFLEATGYPVKRLYAKLNALKAKQVLVAMDACFSGVGGRSVVAKGTRPLVGKVDLGSGVAGRVAGLTASASDEVTGTDEVSGHGLFTYQLLKSLNARSGKATMKELYDALSPKVRDAARRDNRDQTPQLIGIGAASL